MESPAIAIDAMPQLDTAVGLFGSFVDESATAGASVFEVGITVIMIIYD